jgi:hypothetical protein
MSDVTSVLEDDLTLGQVLWAAVQIGFLSAALSVVEFLDLLVEFVRRGKRQTDLVDYD